jgi:serine/threonine-protein phosphatase PGAM5
MVASLLLVAASAGQFFDSSTRTTTSAEPAPPTTAKTRIPTNHGQDGKIDATSSSLDASSSSSSSSSSSHHHRLLLQNPQKQPPPTTQESNTKQEKNKDTDKDDDELLFHDQCLQRQLFHPKLPYPAWDYNWDGKMTPETSLEGFLRPKTKTTSSTSSTRSSTSSGTNTTRHVILIRHGQYDETHSEDAMRVLTPLGRQQAAKTGRRLAEVLQGSYSFQDQHPEAVGPCRIKAIHSSDMVRAKETARIIASYLPATIPYHDPDPLLNEALPSPMIPIRPDIPNAIQEIDDNHDRIEQAFQKYFYRATTTENSSALSSSSEDKTKDDEATSKTLPSPKQQQAPQQQDEFEIIVCHGNVIRYMFCRALQLPPEAWLRMSIFNCSMTYLMIRPNGLVSARMLGDIGHLPYDESTFSMYYGFKW